MNKFCFYFSEDYGKTFMKITNRLPSPKIYKHSGVQRNPHDPAKIYLVDVGEAKGSRLFVSTDGGRLWNTYQLGFHLTGDMMFHPNEDHADYLLASSSLLGTKTVYASFDNGQSWSKIDDFIQSYRWGTEKDNDPKMIYAAIDVKHTHPFLAAFTQVRYKLFKYPNGDRTKKFKLLDDVVSFGHQGKFLYASVYTPSIRGERLMKVSTDQGKTWTEAQLPTVTGDRFFSVLDMYEQVVFLHVDNPGDTGHGTLYISGSKGVVYTESLPKHLYPNYHDVTDFYRVESMRGVYMTSQMSEDDSIHTVITFNRGADWMPLPRPSGAPCKDEKKPCHLQIHGSYSLLRGIQAEPPLSVESAKGIVLVHGHVADALQTTPPDVYITSDGGYSWRLALKGRHKYQIADSGSLIVALPADTPSPTIIKFSTDEGRCWHEYTFMKNTSSPVTVTGLLTEPGAKSLTVSVWGYHRDTRKWVTYVIEFKKVLTRQCQSEDYETWVPHETLRKEENKKVEGCLLGEKEQFKRVKKDSWCFNGYGYKTEKDINACLCTREDFECDYGYYRPANTDDCKKISNFQKPEIDICLRGHVEEVVTEGYRKIPGDKCNGGFKAAGKMIDMKMRCSEGDKSLIIEEELPEQQSTKKSHAGSVLLAILVIVTIALVVMGVFFVHKYIVLRRHRVVYRYSLLNQNETADNDPDDAMENVLTSSSVVYQESSDDEELNSPAVRKETASGKSRGTANGNIRSKPQFKSYHDDSDVHASAWDGNFKRKIRLKSVTNIQKITKSMKMVSAAKYAKAERELKPAKAYGVAANALTDNLKPKESEEDNRELVVALTSDRGLCGAVHSSIVKAIKARVNEEGIDKFSFILIGDKSKAMLQRIYKNNIVCTANTIGRTPPVFADAGVIADAVINQGYQDFPKISMYFNIFKSVVSYKTSNFPLLNAASMQASENIPVYDSLDEETLQCYNEFCLASTIYYGLKESACSEQSSRMTAMDSASKNAGEMIDKLTLTFNRTRQAVITKELIEIISGAAAL
ncbi:hypothetical protein FSP39_014357 [Pinctada imbricata]|uniref:F-ATPase gamma subunit n=1 Tax=Pinctada imbricata TaxID=66713 RepID=A0AA89C7L7_PINIB|nr:hypothetical protein FSP39_014357 [Pinctada imbricata]